MSKEIIMIKISKKGIKNNKRNLKMLRAPFQIEEN